MFSIISFNVNGLRRCITKRGRSSIEDFLEDLAQEINVPEPALICLQETKLTHKGYITAEDYETYCAVAGYGHDVPKNPYSGVTTYYKRELQSKTGFWNPVKKKYVGCSWAVQVIIDRLDLGEAFPTSVGVLTADELQEKILPISRNVLDVEGRCITIIVNRSDVNGGDVLDGQDCRDDRRGLDCRDGTDDDMAILNVYCLAASTDDRLEKKLYAQVAIECLLSALSLPAILVGDLNCTHRDYKDSAGHHPSNGWINYLEQEYQLKDTFLEYYRRSNMRKPPPHSGRDKSKHDQPVEPEQIYTCWNQMTGARLTNSGSRIDYILAHDSFIVSSSHVHGTVLGSDHCPISATFNKISGKNRLHTGKSDAADKPANAQTRLLSFLTAPPAKKTRTEPSPAKFVGIAAGRNTPEHTFDHTPFAACSEASDAFINQADGTTPLVINNDQPFDTSSIFIGTDDPASIDSGLGNQDGLIKGSMTRDEQLRSLVRYLSRDEQERFMETSHFAPRCKVHKLPCILRQVKNRKSANFGRLFWCCCMPNGTDLVTSRCNFFAWFKK